MPKWGALRQLLGRARAVVREHLASWPLRLRHRFARHSVLGEGAAVVSLTSHGRRLATVHLAIESIAQGDVRPHALLLHVGKGTHAQDWPGLRRLVRRGLQIIEVDDVGPHTKYWPALAHPDLQQRALVTADDDIVYPRDWLSRLLAVHQQHPHDVVAHRAYRVRLDEQGLRPYDEWPFCVDTAASVLNFATGVSGVLYPPAMVQGLREAGDGFLALCPKADDVWLHAVAVRYGFAVRQVTHVATHFPLIAGSQVETLMASNVDGGGNDVQLRRTHHAEVLAALRRAPDMGVPEDGEDLFTRRDWVSLLQAHGWPGPQGLQWLPVFAHHGAHGGDLPLAVGRAGWVQGFTNYYAPLLGMARVPGQRPVRINWRRCAADLAQRPDATVIQLQPMPAHANWWQSLREALAASGYYTDTYACFGNWYLPLDGQTRFDDYWRGRPSKLRNTVARAQKKLARAGGRIEVLTAADDTLARGIAAYEAVYAASWKEPEPCPGLMPALMRWAASLGYLRLGLLHLEGQVVAAQVWLVEPCKAHIYKLAYVPGHEGLSVGSVLTAAMMQRAIDEDRVREVDYLMGDDAYKQDWMTHRRERVGLLAIRRRDPRGWLVWGRHVAGRMAKAWRARRA